MSTSVVHIPANRQQILVPHDLRGYPTGQVIARDPRAGALVRCRCGSERWTAFGQARRHADVCAVVAAHGRPGRPARGVRGHALRLEDGVWRCRCGRELGRTQKEARRAMAEHRVELVS